MKELIKIIEDVGLAHISDRILDAAKESIRLITQPTDENDCILGASKIGGIPHLPDGIEWAESDGIPLSFIAQINMKDTMVYDKQALLPRSGIIYFFYNIDEQPWGYDPSETDGWKVLYYNGDISKLKLTAPPTDEFIVFHECALKFTTEITLSPWESSYSEKLGLSGSEQDLYYDLMEEMETLYKDKDDRINRMLGHPNAIQGDMQLQCQLVTNGLYCGDSSGYSDPRRFELEKGAENWILLFQVDSDESTTGMMWGDEGRIYYWIKEEDLKKCNFENTWQILQCG